MGGGPGGPGGIGGNTMAAIGLGFIVSRQRILVDYFLDDDYVKNVVTLRSYSRGLSRGMEMEMLLLKRS
jgi:hypothetical protein